MPFQGPPPPSNPPVQVQNKTITKSQATTDKIVHQQSSGPNSPNIVTGNNSPVTITSTVVRNPRFREKIDRVTLRLGAFIDMDYSVKELAHPRSDAFQFGTLRPFALYMESGTIYLDVTMPSYPPGKLPPIEIKHNEFSQPPPGWDRNFDDSALEFVNQTGVPILQLIYGSSDVTIRGVFVIGNSVLAATENGTQYVKFDSAHSITPPITPPAAIFRYPSRSHSGERVAK